MEGRGHTDKHTFGRVFVQDLVSILISHPNKQGVGKEIVTVGPQVGSLAGLIEHPGNYHPVVAPQGCNMVVYVGVVTTPAVRVEV